MSEASAVLDPAQEGNAAEPPKRKPGFPQKYSLELWEIAREEYVSGKASLPSIAARHKINIHSLTTRCAAGLWSAERTARLVQDRANKRNGHTLKSLLPPATTAQTSALANLQESVQRYYAQAAAAEIQLDRVNQLVLSERDPKTLTQLLRSKSILLDQWRGILGLPSGKSRRTRNSADKQPGFRRAEPQTALD